MVWCRLHVRAHVVGNAGNLTNSCPAGFVHTRQFVGNCKTCTRTCWLLYLMQVYTGMLLPLIYWYT